MTASITQKQVFQFAKAWYQALDVHAPLDECLAMLADTGLTMRFPDGDITDSLSFQKWYERVTNLFFDEKHTVLKVEILGGTDDQAEIAVTVRWQASWWEPPAANSQRVDLESAQRWIVRRCPAEKNPFGLEIVSYILAEEFKYAPGSTTLGASAPAGEDLAVLNRRFAEMEDQGDAEAAKFFGAYLSHNLVFRRASGKVDEKFGKDGFLEGLANNPFRPPRVVEDLSVTPKGDRALVTLIIVGTRKDDGSVHRYRNIRLFSRNGGHWVLEFWYNYEIPGQ